MGSLFKRKIYDTMLAWKNTSAGKTSLLIEGARRVGKSTLVREFAEKEYRSCIIIDFNTPKKTTKELILSEAEYGLDDFLYRLSLSEDVPLYERESVIVFDEVQTYPKMRQLMKYLVEDGRFDYIETGSLISIKRNERGITIPSEEERIQMHPMDFEEFLWACGDTRTVPFLRELFENRKPAGALHAKFSKLYREYMFVGGMPQAVDAFVRTKNFEEVEKVRKGIISLYRADMVKTKSRDLEKAAAIFDNIPASLSKHDKKFSPSQIIEDARTRDFLDSLHWLSESKMVNMCYAVNNPSSITFNLNTDFNDFKVYMADTGLLISLSFGAESLDNEIVKAFVFDKLSINQGMFFENIVAQELAFHDRGLRFAVFRSSERRYEVDFLLGSGKKIIPIEVKSGMSGKHASLDRFIEKYHSIIGEAFVVHSGDLRVDGNITYVPVYMVSFL